MHSGIPDLVVNMDIGGPHESRHIFLVHGDQREMLMLSVKGLSPVDFEHQHLREAAWPAGSPYFIVHRPRVGQVFRGSMSNGKVFKRMPLNKAARLMGSGAHVVAAERWLRLEAAKRWGGAWADLVKTLPPLDFDLIQVNEQRPIEE